MAGQDRSLALAALAIIAASISVNLGAAIGKQLFNEIGPEGVAALRSAIAAPILLAFVRPWRTRMEPGELRWIVLYGAILGAMNLSIYWAFERIPIGLAVTIEISGPLAVVLLTSRSLRDLLWFALALAGLLLLVPWPNTSQPLDPIGIAFALAAAACWALYIVVGKRASRVKGSTVVAIGMCVACAVTLPFGIISAGSALIGPALAMGAVVAVLSSALPYFLEMRALERVSSRVFGVITSSAPAIAALMAYLVLGEQLTPTQWLAVGLMIAASAGCSISTRPAISRARDIIGG